MQRDPATVVLVEGESDRQALLALGRLLDRDLAADRVEIVAMGGATEIGNHVRRLRNQGTSSDLVGLCDIKERRYFERVLDDEDIFVCDADLEDELLRALGAGEVEAFIESQGELKAFRIYQKQVAQRTKPLHQQAHRFCGTLGGRNIRYAPAIIEWLSADRAPRPLRSLLDAV